MQRDSLMIQRRVQGWTWDAIAQEAGISVTSAKNAVRVRQETAPIRLNTDPVRVIEQIMEGYQLSVGDFEMMAQAALDKNHIAAAVGAKRGANDAREKMLLLLQATGRLPQDLGTLRHLIDIRAIAVQMLDTMDEFEREMTIILRLGDPAQTRDEARAASDRVRRVFGELMGLGDSPVDGEAEELPALPEGT